MNKDALYRQNFYSQTQIEIQNDRAMNKQNNSPDYPEKDHCKGENPETTGQNDIRATQPHPLFQRQPPETKRGKQKKYRRKMKNTLKGGKTAPAAVCSYPPYSHNR